MKTKSLSSSTSLATSVIATVFKFAMCARLVVIYKLDNIPTNYELSKMRDGEPNRCFFGRAGNPTVQTACLRERYKYLKKVLQQNY